MSKHISITDMTRDEMEKAIARGFTKHTANEIDDIITLAQELEISYVACDEMEWSVKVWLSIFAPDAGNEFAKYEVQSAVELAGFMFTDGFHMTVGSGTGGECREIYPVTTWKKWLKSNRKYLAELKVKYEFAKYDMISQSQSVNWWAE